MSAHEKINYLELPAADLGAVKTFFSSLFGWRFVDYGEEYTAFFGAGLDGGFFKAPLKSSTANGAALVVLYSDDLASTKEKVLSAGGALVQDVFEFPGGRRFHFADPAGNEWAVWSDQ